MVRLRQCAEAAFRQGPAPGGKGIMIASLIKSSKSHQLEEQTQITNGGVQTRWFSFLL